MSAKKYKVLIADDEPAARKKIISFLKKEDGEYIIKEAQNGIEAAEIIDGYNPDLIFLDIQMPGLSGFELIEAVGTDKMPAIVFTTAYDQYAVDAFEVNAVDYLLKPFDSTRFKKSLLRALAEIEKGDNPVKLISGILDQISKGNNSLDKFLVKKDQRYFFVPADKIYFFSAEDKYVKISTEEGSYLIREKLADLEEKLDPAKFRKIHRSTIVNINFVKEIQPWSHGDFIVILTNGKKLNASRNFRDNIFG